jgi:hypothetical protein
MWEWYFEQPHGLKESDGPFDTWAFVQDSSPEYFTFNLCTPEDLAYKRTILPRLLRPLEVGRKLADRLFDENHIDPSKTIVVQYRGNDSLHDPWTAYLKRKPLMEYCSLIDGLLDSHPGHRLWIQSDDADVILEFKKRYPDSATVPYFMSVPHTPNQYVDQMSPKSGYHRGLDAVAMMIMLSRCSVMVKSISNLAEIAASLSTGEVIHIDKAPCSTT